MEEKLKNAQGLVFFKIQYIPEKEFLYCEWIGFINNQEQAKRAYEKILDFARCYRVKKILNSNKKQVGPWPKVEEWFGKVWLSKAYRAGVEYFAHLHSRNLFTQASAERALSNVSPKINFGHFYDEDQALNWLREQY